MLKTWINRLEMRVIGSVLLEYKGIQEKSNLNFHQKTLRSPFLYLRQSIHLLLLQTSFRQYVSIIDATIFFLNLYLDASLFKSNDNSFHFSGRKFEGKCERKLFLQPSITKLFVLFDIDRWNIFWKLCGDLLCTILCINILHW